MVFQLIVVDTCSSKKSTMLILKGWECLVVTSNLGCNLRYHQVGCDPDTNRSHRQRFVLEKRHRGGGFSFSAKLRKDLHKGFKYDTNISFKVVD